MVSLLAIYSGPRAVAVGTAAVVLAVNGQVSVLPASSMSCGWLRKQRANIVPATRARALLYGQSVPLISPCKVQ